MRADTGDVPVLRWRGVIDTHTIVNPPLTESVCPVI